MLRTHRPYPPEFRSEALRLAADSDRESAAASVDRYRTQEASATQQTTGPRHAREPPQHPDPPRGRVGMPVGQPANLVINTN